MMPVHVAAIIHFYAIISREKAGMYILIGVGVLITFMEGGHRMKGNEGHYTILLCTLRMLYNVMSIDTFQNNQRSPGRRVGLCSVILNRET